ncbi:MAG: ATP synthase subunit I [Halanaerobiales bacterium]|nr:ATP synthase subunit I [Halanaerobiales bacterium]
MNYLNNPDRIQIEILKRTYIISIIPIFYALISGEFESLLGFVFGLVISTFILRLRVLNIERALDMEEKKAETFIRNRYFIEYIIYFIVLLVARLNPSLNFLAAALGLFMIKFTVIGWSIIDLARGGLNKKLKKYKNFKSDKSEKGGD